MNGPGYSSHVPYMKPKPKKLSRVSIYDEEKGSKTVNLRNKKKSRNLDQ